MPHIYNTLKSHACCSYFQILLDVYSDVYECIWKKKHRSTIKIFLKVKENLEL